MESSARSTVCRSRIYPADVQMKAELRIKLSLVETRQQAVYAEYYRLNDLCVHHTGHEFRNRYLAYSNELNKLKEHSFVPAKIYQPLSKSILDAVEKLTKMVDQQEALVNYLRTVIS